MRRPHALWTGIGISVSSTLAIAALLPASVSAAEISAPQVDLGVVLITADKSFDNEIGITWVTSPTGAPDLVIGDTRAGIPDPVPSPCARVSQMIVRCPADAFTRLEVDLGPGADSINVVPAVGIDGFISMRLDLGLGNDRASDAGKTRDVWN